MRLACFNTKKKKKEFRLYKAFKSIRCTSKGGFRVKKNDFVACDIDGFFAVLLWDEYQRTGDQKALETLLAYNIQDTVTLENLTVTAYNMKLKDTPFYETHLVEEPTLPRNPYSTDLATVDRIKNSPQYWQSQQWY